MFKTYKYTTKHLVSIFDAILNEYQIFEINEKELIAVYKNKNEIMLNPKIPEDITKYKYFNEMQEIISQIFDE